MAIDLEEVTQDSEEGMICAAYMRIASFPSRSAFEASDFKPSIPGPYRATETDTFDIWADDPALRN